MLQKAAVRVGGIKMNPSKAATVGTAMRSFEAVSRPGASLAQIFYERGDPEDQDGEDQESNKPHAPHAADTHRSIISHNDEPHLILVTLASANKAAALRKVLP
jgi:hypothetical protein